MALSTSALSPNMTELHIEPTFCPTVEKLILSLFIIIALVGIFGNGLIVFAFAARIVPVTPFMVLLLNLSIADIIIDVSVFPFLFWEQSENDSNFACGIHKQSITWSAVVVNAATLTYISFVRISAFDVCSKSLNQPILKPRNVNIYVALTWVVGILLFSPHYFNFYFDPQLGVCIAKEGPFYKISSAVQSLLCWVVPVTILSVNLFRTVRALWNKEHLSQSMIIKHRKQITFLLLGLTVFFLLFSTPLLVFFVLRAANYYKFTNDLTGIQELKRFYRPVSLVCLLTTITDPLLYAFCWKSFRNGFSHKKDVTSLDTETNSLSSVNKIHGATFKSSTEDVLLMHSKQPQENHNSMATQP